MIIFDNLSETNAIRRADPRLRVVATAVWAILACLCDRPAALVPMLVLGAALVILSGLPASAIRRRMIQLNVFVAFFILILPLTIPGENFFALGSLGWSREGLERALVIALRANSIVLACAALLGTMEAAHFGIALRRLGLPKKLTHIFLFTIRYTETVHIEYHRLRDAMKLRAFKAGCDSHTLRSIGYLIGMLLVRSAERSERILEAMKCRGFTGELYTLEEFRFGRVDFLLSILIIAALAVPGYLQWM
ncbi:MAG: cobalt ECF transporter T component CbiQ [Planctomycetes bacterium]|nr:cobalt ECF transporter T component CbiQ [Planctomycetota bacterium]